jgi:hypothetical protein
MHQRRHGSGRRDIDHRVQRREQQYRRGRQSTFRPACGNRLPPNLLLQLVGFSQLLFGRYHVWQFPVHFDPRIQVAPETLAQRRLSVSRKQVEPEVCGANIVGLLDNQLPPRIESRARTGEGKSDE